MVFAVGRCPIGCLVGGLAELAMVMVTVTGMVGVGGCGGEPLTLGTKVFDHADVGTSAAASGSPAWQPPTAAMATMGASGAASAAAALAGTAGAASATQAVSSAGIGGTSVASTSLDGTGHAAAGSGGNAAGSSRPRRRSGSAGEAAGGTGSSSGTGSVGGSGGRSGQTMAQAGSGARTGSSGGKGASAGAAGSAANGCVENLSCQLMAPESTGDVHQDCVDRINQFRVECACLPALERWHEGEACADEMAKYDSGGSQAHAGFGDKICDGGSAQNECPGWRSESQVVSGCLQKMWDEGPPPMSDCTGSCFQTYGHFLNMTNQRMTKVACGFYTTSDGQVWSVQNFTR